MADLAQLKEYMDEFGKECIAGVLIAEAFPKSARNQDASARIRLLRHKFSLDWSSPRSFPEILANLELEAD